MVILREYRGLVSQARRGSANLAEIAGECIGHG